MRRRACAFSVGGGPESKSAPAEDLRSRGIEFKGPAEIHLGKRAIMLKDPDGLGVLVASPTESSPEWIKNMVE
jgi:hypothetical protein